MQIDLNIHTGIALYWIPFIHAKDIFSYVAYNKFCA